MSDDNKDPKNLENHDHASEDFEENFDFEIDEDPIISNDNDDDHAISGSAPAVASSSAAKPSPQKSSVLPFVIGTALIAFVGWKSFSWLTSPKKQDTASAVKLPAASSSLPPSHLAPQQASQPAQQLPAAPVAPTAAPPSSSLPAWSETEKPTVNQSPLNQGAAEQFDQKIQSQESKFNQSMADLDNKMRVTYERVENSDKALNNMQMQVSTLATQMQVLMNEVKALRHDQMKTLVQAKESAAQVHKQQADTKKAVIHRAEAHPSLVVHAIIPGRAWLKTMDGKTITVAEGDSLKEYGRVLKIDAANGIVVTASGVTLR